MGVYYYIVNRTLKERVKQHYGKWLEFDFQDVVKDLCERMDGWFEYRDIWAIGDVYSNAVKYFPQQDLTDDEMTEAMEKFKKVSNS